MALADQQAIEKVLAANSPALPGAEEARRPMSEVSVPQMRIRKITFPTRDTAIVHGDSLQFGSLMMKQTVPVAFWMTRSDTGEWTVAMRLE